MEILPFTFCHHNILTVLFSILTSKSVICARLIPFLVSLQYLLPLLPPQVKMRYFYFPFTQKTIATRSVISSCYNLQVWASMESIAIDDKTVTPHISLNLDLQLLVSLATATMPMGCWGMSARNTFISAPVYFSARSTALLTQSVQKM